MKERTNGKEETIINWNYYFNYTFTNDFYFNKKNFEQALRSYVDAHKMSVNNFTKDNILKIEMRINDLKIRMGEDIFNRITKELKYAK